MMPKLKLIKPKLSLAARRRQHMALVWALVKDALEWNRNKKGALSAAMAAVQLRKSCNKLDAWEREMD